MTPVKLPEQPLDENKTQAQAVTQIQIQEQTFTQLTRAAQARQISVEELAEQIIREHLRATARDQMTQEMEAYRAQHPEILTKYKGEHIAMYHGQIVDHDIDPLKLYLRIDERYPDDIVLLKEVKEQVDDVFNIPSFRIVSE